MSRVMVGLGGNIGNPEITLRLALEDLKRLGSSFKTSKLYKTKPVSSIEQPVFFNAVVCFDTFFSPEDLFLEMQKIESKLGKVKKHKEAPRPIDLDLLFYGENAYETGGLSIPHPRWKERLFVLIPLADLLEEIQVAGEKWNIKQLIQNFPLDEVQEIYDEARAY